MCVLEISVILAFSLVAAKAHHTLSTELLRQISDYALKTVSKESDVYEDGKLDVPDLIKKYGYPCEVHNVITPDGYILGMHRIPHGRDKNTVYDPKKIPVLVVHGLLCSSADFIVSGPGIALGYLLAEIGYDVWLVNNRGNYYSRKHVSLDPDAKKQAFWKFSFEEMGRIDVPAIIDYISGVTKHSKMHYIGHSQGGSLPLVLGALRPEYNDKFISFHALAPGAFFIYKDTLLSIAEPLAILSEKILFKLGHAEVGGRSKAQRRIGANICSDDSKLQPLCLNFPGIGKILRTLNTTKLPTFLAHTPAGSSIRQIGHYARIIKNGGNFTRFDYGLVGNLARYGTPNSPIYDLQKVTMPTYIYYSVSDEQITYKNVLHLARLVPNLKALIKIPRADFTHVDYHWATDARSQVYDTVFRMMKQAESEN